MAMVLSSLGSDVLGSREVSGLLPVGNGGTSHVTIVHFLKIRGFPFQNDLVLAAHLDWASRAIRIMFASDSNVSIAEGRTNGFIGNLMFGAYLYWQSHVKRGSSSIDEDPLVAGI